MIDSADFTSVYSKRIQSSKNCGLLLVMEAQSSSGTFKVTFRSTNAFRKKLQIVKSTDHYVIGHYNGLFLLERPFYHQLALWNPSIRKILILPPLANNIVVNGNKSDCYFMGFSPRWNDFRICCTRKLDYYSHPPSTLQSAIYSLTDKRWRHTQIKWNFSYVYAMAMNSHTPCVTEGVVHWIVSAPRNNKKTHVLSFDFDTEKFQCVKLPESECYMSKCLFVLGDLLAVFGLSPSKICIWVSNKNDCGDMTWSKKFTRDLGVDRNLLRYSSLRHLTYDDESSTIFWAHFWRGMFSYNIKTSQIRHLGKSIRYGIMHHELYKESLVLSKALPQDLIMSS